MACEEVNIELKGCDDSSSFRMTLRPEEFLVAKWIAERSQEASAYVCQPKMVVEVVKS